MPPTVSTSGLYAHIYIYTRIELVNALERDVREKSSSKQDLCFTLSYSTVVDIVNNF